jgi:hypothetical protein
MNKIILYCAMAASCAVSNANSDAFHNHVHNFSNHNWTSAANSDPVYAFPSKHAAAMGYESVLNGNPADRRFADVGNIKALNSSFLPVKVDVTAKTVKYIFWLVTDNLTKMSAYNPERNTWTTYALEQIDLDLLAVYGCAKEEFPNLTTESTAADMVAAYYYDTTFKTVYINLQNKAVVDNMIAWSLQSVLSGDPTITAAFFDDLNRKPTTNCANKDSLPGGYYATWEEGHKAYVKGVTDVLHGTRAPNGDIYRVFGNIWSPAAVARTFQKYYANGSLRLDHYYNEQGFAGGNTQKANGTTPSGQPVFTSAFGYLPANRLSVSGTHLKCKDSTWSPTMITADLAKAAAVAAMQGSWFGWYGQCGVDSTRTGGALVYGNADQLLREIPNWDNLMAIPLSSRSYSSNLKKYTSPNSYFSPGIVYSRNPASSELFVVYRNRSYSMTLRPGEKILSATYADHLFRNTGADAKPCLSVNRGNVFLRCPGKVGVGIRITTAY